MRPVSFKTKKSWPNYNDIFRPNLKIGRLPAKVRKPRNTIFNLFKR